VTPYFVLIFSLEGTTVSLQHPRPIAKTRVLVCFEGTLKMAWDATSGTSEPTVSNWTEQCGTAWVVPMSLQCPTQASGSDACMSAIGVAPAMMQHVPPGSYLLLGGGTWTPMVSAYLPCDNNYGVHGGTPATHTRPSPLVEPILFVPAAHSALHQAPSPDLAHHRQVATPLSLESVPLQHGGGYYAALPGGLSSRSTAASSCPQGRADAKAAPRPPHGGKGGKSRISQASSTPRAPRIGAAWKAHALHGRPEEIALLQQLEAGQEEQLAAVSAMRGFAFRLSLEPLGCRLVQLAIQLCDQTNRAEFISEFHGHVREMLESPHGNYVIQRIVENMPTALVRFVALELIGGGTSAARHRYGCRIICRLLEHTAVDGPTVDLVDELLLEVRELSRHVFGHHVIKSVVEHGSSRQRVDVVRGLCGDITRHARNRHACYVLEAVLTHCPAEGQRLICDELLRRPDEVVLLAQSQFGHHVVRALIRLPSEASQTALHRLLEASGRLASSRHGRKMLEELRLSPPAT